MAEGYEPVKQNIAIYQGVKFTFNNSKVAVLPISDIDSRLSSALLIFCFSSLEASPYIIGRNMAKTHLQLTILADITLNQDTFVNILAVY